MGNDLYWKITPKIAEEKVHGLSYSTWHFLKDLWGMEDANDLQDTELTQQHIVLLRAVTLTAKTSGNKELQNDIQELIDAIQKYSSITLVIRC